ncbi:putative ABC transport system permease protein [Rhodoglobus vestalii]|uniref:Putative ABC transport system permease protein n=1 Tax=Rhodoglobus vestalii TaxID=193384 RepID=A0A8H2K4J0_9MICO|nr:FtsX-like permease family protein [Rhodoglobus vestalii]TQO19648.1 putative ABC transport system permease protein [Rhodoglobus vestalii]
MNRSWLILREAIASARSAPITSLAVFIMVAGMCVGVMLTTGRTVAAQQSVIATLDAAGTRSIVVRAESGAGVDSTVIARIRNIAGIEWTGAFGPASDVENAAFSGGTRVPVRDIWTEDPSIFDLQSTPVEDSVWASDKALSELGFQAPTGGINSVSGEPSRSIVGRLELPDYLNFLEPAVFHPRAPSAIGEIAVLVIVVDDPSLVGAVSVAVQSVLAPDDITKIAISSSESLARLRSSIQGDLATSGRGLVLGVLGLTGLLLAIVVYGMVALRRKDFGRRRALGASQKLIVALVTLQSTLLALVGSIVGLSGATVALIIMRDPLPGWAFTLAIGILATAIGVVSSLIPAGLAARREPINELRVP